MAADAADAVAIGYRSIIRLSATRSDGVNKLGEEMTSSHRTTTEQSTKTN